MSWAKKQAIGEAQIVAEVSGGGGCRVCRVEALGVLFEVTGQVALVDETGRNGDVRERVLRSEVERLGASLVVKRYTGWSPAPASVASSEDSQCLDFFFT